MIHVMITNDTIAAIHQMLFFLMSRLVVGLNCKSWIPLEIVPQRADKLTDHNIITILLDNMQQENAILFKVFIKKRSENFLVNNCRGGGGGRRGMMMVADSVIDLQIASDK